MKEVYKLKEGEYILKEDITVDLSIKIEDSKTTLDFNDKKLVADDTLEEDEILNVLLFVNNSELVIKGNGTVDNIVDYALRIVGSKVTIENGTFIGDIDVLGNWDDYDGGTIYHYTDYSTLYIKDGSFKTICIQHANLIIDNGTFTAAEWELDDGEMDYNHGILSQYESNITINGGTFTSHFDVINATYNVEDVEQSATNSITINGGTFTSYIGTPLCFEKIKKVEIKGGKFIGGEAAIYYVDSNITLTGGQFIASGDVAIGAIETFTTDKNPFAKLLADGYRYSENFETKTYEEGGVWEDGSEQYYSDSKDIMVIPNEYKLLEGANAKYVKGNNLTFKVSGDIDELVKILVDKQEVSKDDVILKKGSTIATLKSNYLDTLAVGEHTIEFIYKFGQAATTITVPTNSQESEAGVDKSSKTDDDSIKNPKTYDNIVFNTVLLAGSLIASIAVIILKKKCN